MEDKRVCRGDYESAMHYDCAECFAHKCKYRRSSALFAIVLIAVMSITILVSIALIFF
ncbi:MAG: hypothetical protein IPJ03_17720 [Ignavibacteriales bacterium]|nr:hypothetical protein [Ignavibacteriales bacterium]MBK7380800.1 hypothetical protein [Ignavibacteriales bacterium]